MSFLDNLENNLNALERLEEKDPEQVKRDRARRDLERDEALARAPHAEALKSSEFTSQLMTECRTIGHKQRMLVQFTWIGENLRLEGKTRDGNVKRLELAPTAKGVDAVASLDGSETWRQQLDPEKSDAAALAGKWLG